MIIRAKRKAESLGSLNNSILEGRGNLAGYLGEEVIAPLINADIMSCDIGDDKYNHDLVIESGLKVEVKTKRRTVDLREDFDVSVAKTSLHQEPDIYAFISITCGKLIQKYPREYKGVKSIWLCGFMSREEYLERSVFLKKGSTDPTNGFKVHRDMYNMKVRDLYNEIQLCYR